MTTRYDAYQQGRDAYYDGSDDEDNPYDDESLGRAWYEGYCDAEDDDKGRWHYP